ncbi:MAG: hypothetical protein COB20_10835 [SAR86 cluster bacterium]|uniref:Uncharacterized protein n=1 Tax=SAR86 cluster bacterium TaxID=2030880 RepID=A0A2A4X1H0_9GAMM|nr:MAG: hypothetical protein COB20_10835 [SAR86 cluster bacterium]
MQQYSSEFIQSRYQGDLGGCALLLLLIAVCFAANPVFAQRPSLHEGVLTLPYVVSNETAYSAELSLIPASDPVRFELIASQPLALNASLDGSTFADNRLFVTDIDVDGLAYWVELALIESEAGAPPLFEIRDFGVHAAVVSSNQLGLSIQPQWQRLLGSASDIGVGADGSVWAIGTDERSGGFGIYRWLGSTWQRVDGGALRIDVDPEGVPWIVNNSHSIYRWQDGAWQRMGGNARDIGIGADGTVWVTSGGGTYRYDEGNWIGVRGSGVRIDVDPNGIPWVLDHTNDIHQLIAGRWVRRSGEARDIGIGGDGSVWIVGTSDDEGNHNIYRWSGTAWNRVTGSSRQISVGPDGYPWAANAKGNIYRGG